MRKTLVAGVVLAVAAVLVVIVSSALDLELESVALLGGALGAEKLSPTRAAFHDIGDTGTTEVVLGESDTVFQQRVETGLQFTPADKFDLRLSVAANHVDADTKSSDPNLALVGLDNTQADVRNHWEYPIELGGVWKF